MTARSLRTTGMISAILIAAGALSGCAGISEEEQSAACAILSERGGDLFDAGVFDHNLLDHKDRFADWQGQLSRLSEALTGDTELEDEAGQMLERIERHQQYLVSVREGTDNAGDRSALSVINSGYVGARTYVHDWFTAHCLAE